MAVLRLRCSVGWMVATAALPRVAIAGRGHDLAGLFESAEGAPGDVGVNVAGVAAVVPLSEAGDRLGLDEGQALVEEFQYPTLCGLEAIVLVGVGQTGHMGSLSAGRPAFGFSASRVPYRSLCGVPSWPLSFVQGVSVNYQPEEWTPLAGAELGAG